MRVRHHRCDSHKDEISEFLALGKTYNFISDYLFLNYGINIGEPELSVYCRDRALRTRVTCGFHSDKAPHCIGCEHYMEVATHHIRDRHTNVRICKACSEVIPQRTATSPDFCPKR